jgi:paraquat-inducible protein A
MTLGGRRFLLAFAVMAAIACLALGVSLPFIRLTSSAPFTYDHSLISAVDALMRSGQFLIGIVLLIFAIFLPVLKLLYLLFLAMLPLRDIDRLARQLRALEWLGKWSLQDLLALSLTIVLIETQSAYEAASGSGIYCFAAAVLLMLIAHTWLRDEALASRTRLSAAKAAYASARRGLAFNLLFGVAAVLFVLGVTLPAIRLSASLGGTDQHSITTVIMALYARQDYFPCFVLFGLSLLLPSIRLLYLLALLGVRHLPYALRTRSILAIEWLGRHAIADVMMLALMAFYLGASDRAGVSILPGAYCFAASALATMLAYGWANAPSPAATPQPASLAARLAGLASAGTPDETAARR